ncbi:GNAT family N-acetyltransferase [Lactiplantibacillus daowaiensis]|uniref:GNAT family N-acetyltransferase n=1 Tax=Lactiplantibacillus daowaiensis TaxID=2559918 RepID=A0ABW1RZB5_9LACO|nr:GNAT family N-acetyltransferase [Lactiplantibacillus daowaiensis]
MAAVACRWSQPADLPILYRIDQTIWTSENTPVPATDLTLTEYATRYPAGSQLVAEIAGQVVGMISWNPQPALPAWRYTWEIGIGVALTAQHQGVGQSLMSALKQTAKRAGIHRISLRVLGTNQAARQFYAQQGFQVEGVLRDAFWLNGHFVDDYQLAYLV